MNVSYLWPPLMAAGLGTILLVFVLVKGRQRRAEYRVFSLLLFSIILWAIFIFAMRASPDVEQALRWDRAMIPIGFAVSLFYYHFSLVLTNIEKQRALLVAGYLVLVIIAALSPTSLIIQRMIVYHYGYSNVTGYAPTFGPAIIPFIGFTYFLTVMAIYNLVKGYLSSSTYEDKNRLLYITIAMVLPFIGGLIDVFPTSYPGSIFGSIAFCLLASVAVLKYHLLDIKFVIRRGTAYLLISAMVAIPYVGIIFLFTYVFKTQALSLWVYFVPIIALAMALQPLWVIVQRRVDKWFYRERYDYFKALERFNYEAQSITNLNELSSTVIQLVNGALRTSRAYILLESKGNKGFEVMASVGCDKAPYGLVLNSQSPVIKWLKAHGDILSSKELDIVPQLQCISREERRDLERMEVELCVPLRTRDGELPGIMALGERLSGQPFSREDEQLLMAVSNQMAMVLENARLYKELRESEERYRTLFESAAEGILITDRETQEFIYANPAISNMLGYSTEELKEMGISDIYPKDSLDNMISDYEARVQGEEAVRRNIPCIRKDGTIIYADISATKAIMDEKEYLIGFFSEVTERKLAEERLWENEEFMSSLLNNSPYPLLVLNPDTSIRYVSPAMERLTGFTPADLIGRKAPYPYWTEGTLNKNIEDLRRVMKQGVKRLEEHFQKKNGAQLWVEITSTPVIKNGEFKYYLSNWVDITERKQAEKREKQLQNELLLSSRLASVGELAAGVAHEINNPLTGVIGFSQLLMKAKVRRENAKYVRIIHDEAGRVANIVKRLLVFSRQQKPERSNISINEVIETTLALLAYELRTSNIKVDSRLDPDLPPITADAGQLQQVVLNIIINAEKEMELAHGKGNLLIKTERIGNNIRISFKDDGPGIDEKNLQHIFDPFFTTRAAGQGTGLGLSVCHGIVSEHGGRIYAESALGKGATFIVELPMVSEGKQYEPIEPTVDRPGL